MAQNTLKRLTKGLLDRLVIAPARRFEAVREILAYCAVNGLPHFGGWSYTEKLAGYENLKAQFVDNGASSPFGKSQRVDIIERFERIDREVEVASTPTDGLFLAEALLSIDIPGNVVECGCFNGGSTAKLSILAKITGRRLKVFDSFEGLPDVDEYNKNDHHMRRPSADKHPWESGQYAATLDRVRDNVERFGEAECCEFIKGWFNETLPGNLPAQIAFAFTDVDIPSSAKDCVLNIWPRLAKGGIYFSHDIAYVKVLQVLHDERMWRDVFAEHPPIFWGAGYGMGDRSPHLGFAVKGEMPADYIKNLTPSR